LPKIARPWIVGNITPMVLCKVIRISVIEL
jgi:hypothetical protein